MHDSIRIVETNCRTRCIVWRRHESLTDRGRLSRPEQGRLEQRNSRSNYFLAREPRPKGPGEGDKVIWPVVQANLDSVNARPKRRRGVWAIPFAQEQDVSNFSFQTIAGLTCRSSGPECVGPLSSSH
jgi:hypothetical protein